MTPRAASRRLSGWWFACFDWSPLAICVIIIGLASSYPAQSVPHCDNYSFCTCTAIRRCYWQVLSMASVEIYHFTYGNKLEDYRQGWQWLPWVIECYCTPTSAEEGRWWPCSELYWYIGVRWSEKSFLDNLLKRSDGTMNISCTGNRNTVTL